MTPERQAALMLCWAERIASLIGLLAPDQRDDEWRDAMTLIADAALVAGMPKLAAIAAHAGLASREAAHGKALRRAALAQLNAALAEACPQDEAAAA